MVPRREASHPRSGGSLGLPRNNVIAACAGYGVADPARRHDLHMAADWTLSPQQLSHRSGDNREVEHHVFLFCYAKGLRSLRRLLLLR